jgi:hypothetical protein
MEKKSFPSLMCTDIGYSDCSHISYGVIEEALFRNLNTMLEKLTVLQTNLGKKSCRRSLKILENG